MKRIVSIVICFALLAGSAYAESEPETPEVITGVNGFEWNSSVLDVMGGLIENGVSNDDMEVKEIGSNLEVVNQKVSNYNCVMNYLFDDDGLFMAVYTITEKHSSDNLYVDDYNNLNKAYEQVYGSDEKYMENWKETLFKDDPEYKGFAVSKGDLSIVSHWEGSDGSGIYHTLSGDNYKISHLVYYYSSRALQDSSGTKDTTGV